MRRITPSPAVQMRLFLALELAPPLLASLEDAIAPLRELEPDLSWAAPDRRHLTLKFIGDADAHTEHAGPDPLEQKLIPILDSMAASHRPFQMLLGGIGAFPNFRRARVLWIGVEGEPRLELLHHDAEVACAQAGVAIEGRPFRPHVTLARLREKLDLDRARALARAARRIPFSATQEVAAITLFDSVLGTSGARYRRVHTAPLGGR